MIKIGHGNTGARLGARPECAVSLAAMVPFLSRMPTLAADLPFKVFF
jgi:hypothetical protein